MDGHLPSGGRGRGVVLLSSGGGGVIDIGNKDVCVHVSGGGQSAIVLHRCLEWYGHDRVTAVFADTNTESPDLYEFLLAQEQLFGIEIERLSQGMNIWDCFDAFGVISLRGAGGACKASVELKQKPLDKYTAQWQPSEVVIATGLSWMEPERQQRLIKKILPYECIFPLNEKPRLSDCEIIDELERIGLPVPEAYKKGYPHNNCGGGCVLAGIAQWMGLLKDYPERFAWHEKREKQWRSKGRDFTVLRDFRGDGKAKPYTLEQMRLDVESGAQPPNDFRSGCGCMLLSDGSRQITFKFEK